MKPLLFPLRRRKSLVLRCASSPANTIPVPTKGTTTATTNRVSIYSSSAVADPDFAYKLKLVEEASKTTMGMGTRRSSEDREEEEKEAVLASKLDDWIRDSVTEIVRNIEEAPFLVHIYSSSSNEAEGDDDGSSSSSKTTTTRKTRFERELAVSEDWPRISRRWKENSSCKPDGIILVEQLKGDEEEEEDDDDDRSPRRHRQLTEYCSSSGQCQCSKSWGIVIQGRGLDRAACYILKTSRVCSSVGFCTHFCLVRAKCLGEPAELQLRDCWLQRP